VNNYRVSLLVLLFEDVDLDSNLVMVDFDTSQNSIREFINMILRWLEEAKRSDDGFSNASKKSLNDFHQVIFFSHKFVKLF
jgi:predicted ATP-grasp superfamily ATP-dependent carboligase